jgi:hypothetical protein
MLSKKLRNLEKYGAWLNELSCYEDNGYDAYAAQAIVAQCVHETQTHIIGSIDSSIGGPIHRVHTVRND